MVEPVCPKSCLCLEDFKYIDCSNGRLTEVPHDLPNTAVILDLSHNRIKEIKPSDFSHRLKLQEINLSNNLLENVTEEVRCSIFFSTTQIKINPFSPLTDV